MLDLSAFPTPDSGLTLTVDEADCWQLFPDAVFDIVNLEVEAIRSYAGSMWHIPTCMGDGCTVVHDWEIWLPHRPLGREVSYLRSKSAISGTSAAWVAD
jgi:hypothetical protein